mmetsp:Transcript_28739/g.71616  ORF Transcript_28739/g.71616 Transcript_28739/m.71616 type:complete len:718 (+) Transcript_28739:144-2297(+)
MMGNDKSGILEAIKYGEKRAANPGRLGDKRWRFFHKGMMYITDETCRHVITSWRANDASLNIANVDAEGGAHAVLVVDHSGSMRTNDVPGYATRTAAVYDCLARDFVEAQIAAGAGPDVVVTVIEMSDTAEIVIEKASMDASLVAQLKNRACGYAHSHGKYLPALDKALEILREDAQHRRTLMLLFLSDGSPSDHIDRACGHGVHVWKRASQQNTWGRNTLRQCGRTCRADVQRGVARLCLAKVLELGEVLGRDRVVVGTVAFGDTSQNYDVLRQMGEALPRGSFQKLALNAGGLRTAFSSLSSSLTTLRTDGGSLSLTLRDKQICSAQQINTATNVVTTEAGWFIYSGDAKKQKDGQVLKYRYSVAQRMLVNSPFDNSTGIAFYQHPFAQGVERYVFRCAEINVPTERADDWWDKDSATFLKALSCPLRLVAKESKHNENLGQAFQEDMARIQAQAGELAKTFNRLVGGPAKMQLNFLDVDIYLAYDSAYPKGEAWVLVEQELEGKFRKWNNNNGQVYQHQLEEGSTGLNPTLLNVICEEEEEEEGGSHEKAISSDLSELPQCFSHFTYEHTGGRSLVCDLQGVWNSADGFVLTDPVIHHVSSTGSQRHKNGGTDHGAQGVLSFFKTHKCGALCRQLDLRLPSLGSLQMNAHREAKMCCVCMSSPRSTRFGPCRHSSCCDACAKEIVRRQDRCPICRGAINEVIKCGLDCLQSTFA